MIHSVKVTVIHINEAGQKEEVRAFEKTVSGPEETLEVAWEREFSPRYEDGKPEAVGFRAEGREAFSIVFRHPPRDVS